LRPLRAPVWVDVWGGFDRARGDHRGRCRATPPRGDQAPEQLARGCSRSAAKAGRHVRVEIDGVSVTGTPVIAEEVVW